MKKLKQERISQGQFLPRPKDGTRFEINPTGFIWLPVPEAAEYEVRVWEKKSGREVLTECVPEFYYVPKNPFDPDDYEWTIRAINKEGAILGEREPWTFSVPRDSLKAVYPSATEVLEKLGDGHPMLVFPWFELDEVRKRARAQHKEELKALGVATKQAYDMGMPPQPKFHLSKTEQQKRMLYVQYFRNLKKFIDVNLFGCSLYYLLTEDTKAGEFARRMMLHVCGWNPEGPNAVDGPWGDELGLSYARCLHECYDWTYELFDKRERIFVENTLTIYAKQTYRRLRLNLMRFTSHLARLYPYLGEHAILLHNRLGLEEAAEMLQFVLDAFNTWYPHWGGKDGGWAEGVSYSSAYNTFYVPFFATFEKLTGFSFWNRPFYKRIRNFFIYCCPSNAEHVPFGDGQERGKHPWTLFRLYGSRFKDPVCSWIASEIGHPPVLSSVLPFLHPPYEGSIEEVFLPNSKLFRGIGWAALHSDIKHPSRDNYLIFKSSPFGSISHQHADQNSFCILSGGNALAIASGYYGPCYGMPHHTLWTRQTKANNCILVDGEGQGLNDTRANGRIVRFENTKRYTYVSGDATNAYMGRLTCFTRHILFVRPDVYIIYDELEANHPATFSWLLHCLEPPQIHRENQIIDVQRRTAGLRARLFASTPLTLKHTDQFETPFNSGIEEEFHKNMPNQHHIAATTYRARTAKIAAVVQVWPDRKEREIKTSCREDYVTVSSRAYEIRARIGPGPALLKGTINGKAITKKQ